MTSGTIFLYILIFLSSYLIGAIPWAYLIGRLYGRDLRKEGSGNIGATNVTRVIGKFWGRVCFLLDMPWQGWGQLVGLVFIVVAHIQVLNI